jgi:cyclic-di-GMP-binding protein
MFGLGKASRDPLADIRSAERWLASFPTNDPLAIHSEVLAELGRVAEPAARRSPQRLDAVFFLDGQCAGLRKSLTVQYIEHAARSSKIEHQLWSALFDLTQAFLVTYYAFAREVSHHAQSAKWQQPLPELLCRQIVHMGLDAKIRLYRYEQWIPAKWAELHALFTLACSRQFERQQLVLGPSGGATTIEHEFLVALLMQLMNSGNMTARHLEWVAGELDEWCAPLRLSLEPSTVTSFYIDLGAREGLRRRTPAPLEGRVLFLDTRPLHSVLMQNVLMLEQKIKGQPLSERTGKRSEQLGLLTKLASQVDPEFKPFARRGERTAAAGTVDAIVGFAKISGFLREEEQMPVPRMEHGKSFGGTMELAVFGRMRNEADRTIEMARRRFAAFAAPGGPWEVKDISQTGFRLLAPMSVANAITLGTLAAIRPHGQTPWTLGIVRRMKKMTADRAEIGLQVIANTLIGVDLVEQRKSLDSDYSVDGESTTINGRTFHGLFLALRKREADAPVQSLIVPASEYQPTKRLKLMTSKAINPIRFGRLLEQQPEWVWATVEPLDLTAPMPGFNTITGTTIPPTAANE